MLRDDSCPACQRMTSGDCGRHNDNDAQPAPFTCPVCRGIGQVPNGFYRVIGDTSWSSSSQQPEDCRACGGTGVVWGPE